MLPPPTPMLAREKKHARFGIRPRRCMARFGQVHFLAVEPRLFGVDEAIERCKLLGREFFAHVEHRGESVARVVGEARARRQRLGTQPVVEQEVEGVAKAHRSPLNPV
jgi:hypothetical protein